MTDVSSDLQTRLDLSVDPFAPHGLPDFFFIGGQRRFLAQRAVHALYFSAGIVLLAGPRGAGKTRMLDEIADELHDVADSCRIDATVMMDGVEVRRAIAAKLGLAVATAQDNASLIAALAQWQPVGREPHPIALLVDDSHLLAVPALAECLQLAGSSGGRLRLLLAGEPDLLAASTQAGFDAAERIELPPLDRQETADYVATRLQAAGYRAESPLSAAQLNDLYRLSGGNFGAIHDWLPSLFASPQKQSAGLLGRLPALPGLRFLQGLPLQHIAIAGGLLLVVVLLILNRGGGEATPDAPRAVDSGDKRSVVLTLPNQAATPDAPSAAPVQQSSPEPAEAAPEPEPVVPPKPEPAKAEAPKPAPVKVQPSKPQPVPTVTSGQKIALPAPQRTQPAPAPASQPQAAPPQNVQSTPAAAVPAVPAAEKAAPVAAKGAADQTADERELLGWSNKQYALQLLGAGATATVTKFVQQAGGAKLYTYRTDLNGKPWYIVVTGPYPTRNAATAAADTLPPALRNQKPWPRAVKNIQADIKQRK